MKKIAVMGFGTVGSGTVEVFYKNREALEKKANEEMDIKYILDIRDFPDSPYADKFTKSFDDVVNDPEISVVVEVMGGLKFAYPYVKAALEAGKNVYSEKPLATTLDQGKELVRLAKEKGVRLGGAPDTFLGGGIQTCRRLIEDGYIGDVFGGSIHMICMNWAAAPRIILSNKAINSVEDLKGLLVRVPTDTYAAWFSALGASPVSGIPFAEVYTNIESGVIEAAEAPAATLSDYSIQEVAKYAFLSNHTYAAACFGTSTAIWNLISADDQAIVTEELTNGGIEFTKLCAEKNAEYLKAFEDAGVTVVEPSADDVAAFQKAAAEAAVTLNLREGVMDEIAAASK